MKFKHLLYAGAALLALSACSKEDADTGNGGNESGEGAYLSLSISLPNAPGTRGINEGSQTEAGTDDEQKVNSLLVLVYKADGNLDVAKTFTAAQLTPNGPNATTGSGNITAYKTTEPLKVATSGPKKVVVIVNPGSHFSDKSALADMRNAMTLTKDQVTGISSAYKEGGATGFLMTNANTLVNQNEQGQDNTETPDSQNPFNLDGSISVDVQGTKTNPTPVTIPVERAVAKIMDVSTEYTKTVTGGSDKVTFMEVALVNGNTKFFPIKMIRESGETDNDYVVDPNFKDQSEQTRSDFYFSSFAGENAIAADDYKELTTTETARPVFYTLENTMHKDEQKTAYTTGLYYKATYYKNWTEGATAVNLYKYAGILYTFDELQTAAAGLGLSLTGLTNTSEASDFKNIGVTKYTNGVCYYPYWIRHVPSNDDLGVMEFGVVRNNVYKMNIQSVKGIGTPDPVDPDPNTPDESSDVMLEVHVQVLPWTVRKNDIDF